MARRTRQPMLPTVQSDRDARARADSLRTRTSFDPAATTADRQELSAAIACPDAHDRLARVETIARRVLGDMVVDAGYGGRFDG